MCLGHPKTKLLIAHGGYNSFLEAAQAGLPIVLMPLFADQFINAERCDIPCKFMSNSLVYRARRFGVVGEVLDKLSLSSDKIQHAVTKTLFDPRQATV